VFAGLVNRRCPRPDELIFMTVNMGRGVFGVRGEDKRKSERSATIYCPSLILRPQPNSVNTIGSRQKGSKRSRHAIRGRQKAAEQAGGKREEITG